MTGTAPARAAPAVPLRAPGLLLGVGLGGFVDGIVLHQVLQWHHLLSSSGHDRLGLPAFPVTTVRGLEVNTLADGLFHAVTWVAAVVGLVLLVGRARQQHVAPHPWRTGRFWGWVVAGWGVFNLVEGTLAHQVLGLHHVRYGPHQGLYDAGFLALGALLLAGGWAWQRRAARADGAQRADGSRARGDRPPTGGRQSPPRSPSGRSST